MKGRIVRYLLIALLVCLGAGAVVGLFGHVHGEEFCPQKFTVQRFSYYEIPLARIQLTPVVFSPSGRGNAALSRHLRTKRLLGSVASEMLRWDIIHMGGISSNSSQGDAEILVKYLEQPGAVGAESWLDWTQNKKHEEVVSLFWPLIAQLAQERLYVLMPDIFDSARAASSAADFTNRVQAELPARIRRLADAERARENAQRAADLAHMATVVSGFPAGIVDDTLQIEPSDSINAEANPEDAGID